MSDPLPEQAAVEAARDARLAEKGYPGEVEHAAELLLGECGENALAVQRELRDRGIECRLVGGALACGYDSDDEIPGSFAEVAENGWAAHYWVEARGRVCEAASESELFWGDAIATSVSPERLGYIVFEDSYGVTL